MRILDNLRLRARSFWARLFPRKAPQPGQFVARSKMSWKGFVGAAPWVALQRDYLVYVPAGGNKRWSFRRHPLLVLIHGCRQTPEEIVAGTKVTELADRDRTLVLLPRQNPRANTWG